MFPIWMEGNYGQHGMKEPQRLQTLVAGLRRAWLARSVAGLAVLSASGATAQTLAKPSDAEICLTANENLSLGSALPRTTVRLDAGATVRIVASVHRPPPVCGWRDEPRPILR